MRLHLSKKQNMSWWVSPPRKVTEINEFLKPRREEQAYQFTFSFMSLGTINTKENFQQTFFSAVTLSEAIKPMNIPAKAVSHSSNTWQNSHWYGQCVFFILMWKENEKFYSLSIDNLHIHGCAPVKRMKLCTGHEQGHPLCLRSYCLWA